MHLKSYIQLQSASLLAMVWFVVRFMILGSFFVIIGLFETDILLKIFNNVFLSLGFQLKLLSIVSNNKNLSTPVILFSSFGFRFHAV